MTSDGLKVLGLIPARGGSKGLPGKNVRLLRGRPLIAWSVDAARRSAYVDAVVVSTDDAAIAKAARDAGAQVPFVRRAELAGDDASMVDVVLDAIDVLAAAGSDFNVVVLVQPTSPLRTEEDIDAAIDALSGPGRHAVVSVCPCEHSPLLSGTLPPDGSLAEFLRPDQVVNRQDLPEFHRLNGAVYVAKVDWLRETRAFVGPGAFAYVMPAERSVDIDTELDFALAECLWSKGRA
jgi:CMP-N,N'-diacetyllegionaminic acid synthase